MKKKLIIASLLVSLIVFSGCKISGTITDNGVGIEGIEINLAGNMPMTVLTDNNGNYEFSHLLIFNRDYTVTPSSDVYNFDPISKNVKVIAGNVSGVDFNVVKGIVQPFRKKIDISAGTEVGTDYQLCIKIGESSTSSDYDVQLEGNCRSDFSDIRFTAEDGSTLLGYWLESVTGTTPGRTAVFWVKIADDLDSDQSIYVYYGNNEASSASNGSETFVYFNDLEKPFTTTGGALENDPVYEIIPTYDGADQTVHPDVVYMPEGWNGYKYWMAITPYPNSNDFYENPVIMVSNDGVDWIVPEGLTNPLIGAPPCDHNCDTDIIYNRTTDEMFVYYIDTRRARCCAGHEGQPYYNHNYLQVFRSSDGINWTGPITSIDWDLDEIPLLLSPAIVQMDYNLFYMWITNGSWDIYFYESPDGINWGEPVKINLDDKAWHLNVEYIPSKNEFWMIYLDNYSNGNVAWAISEDGINWTNFPSRDILTPNYGAWDNTLYRSCFLYDEENDFLKIWYSARNGGIWHTGYVDSDYSDLLDMLQTNIADGWTIHRTGGSWSTSSENVKRGSLAGKLDQTSTSSHQIVYTQVPEMTNIVVEWDMYDDMDVDAVFKQVRINNGTLGNQTGIGVWSGSSIVSYALHSKSYSYAPTGISRTKGWHKFGISVFSDSETEYYIDNSSVGTLSEQIDRCASISVEGFSGGPTTFFVDDIRIRKTSSDEPVISNTGDQETGSWDLF